MNTYKHPDVIALAKALGSNTRDIRKNFDALVYGALRFWTDSTTVRLCCGFISSLDPNVHPACPVVPPEELFRLYRAAVKACPPWSDVLGAVHAHALATAGGEGMGQFFTPEDMADLAAAIAMGPFDLHPLPKDSVIRVLDPTVGAGALLLAQMRAFGEDAKRCFVVGQDLDPLCCAMTAVQFLANAVEHGQTVAVLEILQGCTLTQKDTVVYCLGVSVSIFRQCSCRPAAGRL